MLQRKIMNTEKIMNPINAASIDGNIFMKYMYQAHNNSKNIKRSISFNRGGARNLESMKRYNGELCKNDNDDDIEKLDKLSLINMGARYELLNANRMLVDLDVSLTVFVILTIENKKQQDEIGVNVK